MARTPLKHGVSSLTMKRLAALWLALAASCAAVIEPPEFTLDAGAMAEVDDEQSLYVVPPELFSLRYEEHEELLVDVGAAVRDFLRENGYEILPTATFRRAWEKHEAELGGLYSSRTGSLNQRKMERCLSMTMAELEEERSFGGVLIPKVDYEDLLLARPYTKGTWEGVRRSVRYEGGLSVTRWTNVLTMTLRSTLVTASGETAFEGAGGIAFAQKSLRADGKVALVPVDSEDIEPTEIEESVRLSLGPLFAADAAH